MKILSPGRGVRVSPLRAVWARNFAFSMIGLALSACGTTYDKREVTTTRTQLAQPAAEIAEQNLLGVRIKTFAPGEIPVEGAKAKGISKEVRKAEGYIIAVNLKNTMQRSGHWGPVRVVPAESGAGEVLVEGEIVESDGEFLKLKVDVSDASGAEWFSKEYEGVVNQEMYDNAAKTGTDAFQFVYNQISNDIAAYRNKLPSSRIAKIRQIAELKFAASFAPDIFSGFVKEKPEEKPETGTLSSLFNSFKPEADEPDEGRYEIVRLPAENDPSFQRVKRIRAREHQLIDTLDEQYEGLSRNIAQAYTQWRTARLTEMNAVRKVEELQNEKAGKAVAAGLLGAVLIVAGARNNSCTGCGTVLATAGTIVLAQAIQGAIQASSSAEADRKLHETSMEELSQSLLSEVSPVVLEVEGETVELKGSVEAKFEQWREVMKKLYAQEVGPIDNAPASGTGGKSS